jgi:hypothetical protein
MARAPAWADGRQPQTTECRRPMSGTFPETDMRRWAATLGWIRVATAVDEIEGG